MREAKVLGLEGSISGKLVSGSLERHGAIDQNVGAVGDLQDRRSVMFDDDQAGTLA
jgi:hypothetical protein